VAEWLRRWTHDLRVVGSNLVVATLLHIQTYILDHVVEYLVVRIGADNHLNVNELVGQMDPWG